MYQALRPSQVLRLLVRQHWHYAVRVWGDPEQATPERPLLVLGHGFMDVGASFQFLVDALHAQGDGDRPIVAPDWRGFGLTTGPAADHYLFADYLGDLDALLDALSPNLPVDLLGHSMGGNIVMSYAGARPTRIRRLINLEGFGLPEAKPEAAPTHLAKWLDDLKAPKTLKPYANAAAVAARLQHTNPRLPDDRAAWLAEHWAAPADDGLWHLRADPAHRRISALPYRVDEVLAGWRRISAPTLWVEGNETPFEQWWGQRYPRAAFEARLAQVPHLQRETLQGAGHMLHHDQPEALAQLLRQFL
ncbi:MAG: alpha/beta hydrolase [Ideonella sp. MAG2]|nr:MAG: alpha/beta hydrolase [Ideonella sp. MAG2]